MTRDREKEREEPVDNNNTQEEACNAENINPSGRNSICCFLRPAHTHLISVYQIPKREKKKKCFSFKEAAVCVCLFLKLTKRKKVTPSPKRKGKDGEVNYIK